MRAHTIPALVVTTLLAAACGGTEFIGHPDGWTTDTRFDTGYDTRYDPGWDPGYDPGRDDPWIPDPWYDDPDAGPCLSPPTCPNAPPDHERFGQPCISEMDCGSGNRCLTEYVMVYDGETYVSWLGGTCALWGADEAGCHLDDPSTCPPGTTCLHFGSSGGVDYYGCIDACKYTDTSWNPYDWSCGCREGYQCNPVREACLPGCANDRECCEVWEDLDDDFHRDAGEVHYDEDCTNWCDGDDADEYPASDCQASFACINEGDPDATWHSTCLFDSDCPMDGRCLNEVYHYDPDTGEPHYPDGACIKDRCELLGRGCGDWHDLGGECVNLGTTDDPRYSCFATCNTGYGPEDGDLNPCRHPSDGHPYTCRPHDPEHWFPASTRDGLCMPATITAGSPHLMYTSCIDDEDCVSPLGLGLCIEATTGGRGLCSAWCNQSHAEDSKICEEASSPGAVVPGVCATGRCLASCSVPRGTLASNGCPESFMACYPNDGTYVIDEFHDPDGDPPLGFCLPACNTSADCTDMWGMSMTCHVASGVCS